MAEQIGKHDEESGLDRFEFDEAVKMAIWLEEEFEKHSDNPSELMLRFVDYEELRRWLVSQAVVLNELFSQTVGNEELGEGMDRLREEAMTGVSFLHYLARDPRAIVLDMYQAYKEQRNPGENLDPRTFELGEMTIAQVGQFYRRYNNLPEPNEGEATLLSGELAEEQLLVEGFAEVEAIQLQGEAVDDEPGEITILDTSADTFPAFDAGDKQVENAPSFNEMPNNRKGLFAQHMASMAVREPGKEERSERDVILLLQLVKAVVPTQLRNEAARLIERAGLVSAGMGKGRPARVLDQEQYAQAIALLETNQMLETKRFSKGRKTKR